MSAKPQLGPNAATVALAERIFFRSRPLVLKWFRREARVLPWRNPGPRGLRRDPYSTWISEIMLQQTQVANVIAYFQRWMNRFPQVQALAQAGEDEVLRHWAGLGYYARARNLHQAARQLAGARKSPPDAEGWKALPGVGDYTAGAIASLALNLPEPILDGNVIRVFSRCLGLGFLPGNDKASRLLYWELARIWAQGKNPGDANEALMELGALVCAPAAPRCGECPMARHCLAQANGWQGMLPPAKKKPPAERVRGTACILRRRGKIYLERRASGSFLAGHLSFPMHFQAGAVTGKNLGSVRHSIMHRRYFLEVVAVASPQGGDSSWKRGEWIPEAEVSEVLTNSLSRKIWKVAYGL